MSKIAKFGKRTQGVLGVKKLNDIYKLIQSSMRSWLLYGDT
jgi:hypothetical protein